ncbi:uncharacterized PE-PGRS family protein PE_PGRS54-like [Argiope bruennichi]|uniref:uncharacterized PE-PGRS family protein PE_PGRS54-like n=1 Tax=Argiope bruennichi TaxID=94029 RepID=UPI002494E41A|nr:uncharacterized PE-PGRS family protein PE_PGRS54-like [Argiope bruennichi]
MIPQIFILSALTVITFASLKKEPVHHAPQPYKFGYSVKDKHGEQYREEASDGKNVKGSYGFIDARGIKRQVNYVADHAGFKADINTNEPGTANQNPAAVKILSDAHYGQGGYARIAGFGSAKLGYYGTEAEESGKKSAGVRGIGVGYAGLKYNGAEAGESGKKFVGVRGVGVGYAGLEYNGGETEKSGKKSAGVRGVGIGNGVEGEKGVENGYTLPAAYGGA